MKVSLITETYPPEVNGVAMTLSRLVAGGQKRGHRFQVVRPRQGRLDERRLEDDVDHRPMPGLPIPFYSTLRFGLPVFGQLTRLWKAERPDVVHVATEGPLGLAAVRTARRLKLPLLSTYHTNFATYTGHYGFGFLHQASTRYLRIFHNKTRLTLVPSRSVQDALVDHGFRNVEILGRGVETDLFHPDQRNEELRQKWGVTPETPVALYVGRIAAEKNLPLVIRAFDRLREDLPDARLVLVGDGPMRPSLQRQRPDLIFAGMRKGEDLARHYASGDLFLFASVTETFGNVVTEAMASGLPVVAFDYAAPREHLVEGNNGWLAPFDDDEAFLAATRRAAAARRRWQELGSQARTTAEHLSWPSIVARYEDYLRRVQHEQVPVGSTFPTRPSTEGAR